MIDYCIVKPEADIAGGIWFKVLGMLQQNWAICEATLAGGTELRFFDDQGVVFDRLGFPSPEAASSALWFNGFTRLRDRPSFMSVAGLPQFPLRDSGKNQRPAYSSGEHWQHAPDGFRPAYSAPARLCADDDLERFVEAQDPVWLGVLEELMAEQRRADWMWFVFPQLRGLTRSAKAVYFGIASLAEARAYWQHRVLGDRLRLATELLMSNRAKSAAEMLGVIDARKLLSCATLFGMAIEREKLFPEIVTRFFGGAMCASTVARLERS